MAVMTDGHPTLIVLKGNTSINLWEKEVVPPSLRGGGPIETTTHRNQTWRTFKPRQLKTIGNCAVVVAYDPVAFQEVMALVNVDQFITIDFPDSTHLLVGGHIDNFTLNPIEEGVQPTAVMELVLGRSPIDGSEFEPLFIGPGDYGYGNYGEGKYGGFGS